MDAISREVALRVGLAARALPDTEPRRLIDVLLDCVGHPLTEAKLEQLKVKDLKQAADGELSELPQDALKTALGLLRGEQDNVADAGLPTVQPYQEGDMPNSIRVACASNQGTQLDGHFGSCARFLVYQVSQDEVRLIDIRATQSDQEVEDKNTFRAQLIKDCQLLYIMSIGGPAAAKVVRCDIHPVKQPQGGDIPTLMADLKQVLAGTPPPWLAKVMGVAAEDRVRFTQDNAEEVE